MKPDGGGIQRLTHLLTASLLLHLAVLMAVSGSSRGKPADCGQSLPMSVDYLDSTADRERQLQNPSPHTATLTRVTPISRPAYAPKPRPVTPAGGMSPPKPVGGTAPTPLPGIAPLAPAGTVSTEMGAGVGARKGSGSASGGAGGFGAGSDRHSGGSRGGAQGTGTSTEGTAQSTGHLIADYQALLKRLVEAHKEYPLAARRSRKEGSCLRRFVLSRSGALRQVEALSSCGHAYLDEAATRAITAVGAFPPLPDEIEGAEASFTVSITFTLSR